MVLFRVQIAGAAALLIWSVRLVRTGVERAFVVLLRAWLRRSARSRVLAAGTGLVSAMLLQSSTAVAVLVSGFVAGGGIGPAVGLAILLGADLGSAAVAKVLLAKLTLLEPVLLLLGVGLFLKGSRHRVRQTGRILIGLALIFVSLDMIRAATAPLTDSAGAAAVMEYLSRDVISAFVIGAGFAWVVHSSVAAVLLFVTLVAQGLLPQPAAVAMVLGANLGGSLVAVVLTWSGPIEARRMIATNLWLRGGGAALTLLGLTLLGPSLAALGSTEAEAVINLHVLFNLGVALAALPLLGPITRIVEALLGPEAPPEATVGLISALDPDALDAPDRALSCAAREIMRMGEITETMLRTVEPLYGKWNDAAAAALFQRARTVRSMHLEVKLYLARLHRGELDELAAARSMQLSSTAVSLEGAADLIARTLLELARRLQTEAMSFSEAGRSEIGDFHDRVLVNAQLALDVMMTRNPAEARELVARKEAVRAVEQGLQRQHMGRLREGFTESIDTSSIHQETLRALKQINAAFAMVAHPILAETGDLLESRLTHRA